MTRRSDRTGERGLGAIGLIISGLILVFLVLTFLRSSVSTPGGDGSSPATFDRAVDRAREIQRQEDERKRRYDDVGGGSTGRNP